MMDEKNIERVARAICQVLEHDSTGWPHYEASARAAIVAVLTPPSGSVLFPCDYAGRAVLDGNFSPAELRDIASWLENRLVGADAASARETGRESAERFNAWVEAETRRLRDAAVPAIK